MLIVFGAISMELHLSVDHFPTPSEQSISSDYTLNAGGKAVNQAFSAMRAGAKTALIGKTGDDDYARRILDKVRREGVITSGVGKSDKKHTGLDIIFQNIDNEHSVIKSPGANTESGADQVPEEIIDQDTFVLVQSDISMQENVALLKKAKAYNATTIMNLSPSIDISQETLNNLDYLILNSREATKFANKLELSSIEGNNEKIAQALSKLGELTCTITQGKHGSITATKDGRVIKTRTIQIQQLVDHDGAEDAYCGTFAAYMYQSKPIEEALQRANIAASLTCQRKGGLDTFPYVSEIEDHLKEFEDETHT